MSWNPEDYRKYEKLVMDRQLKLSVPDWMTKFLDAVRNPSSPTTIAPGALPPLAGDVTGAPGSNTVVKVQGIAVSTTDPITGQVVKYNGTAWAPGTDNDTLVTVQEVDGSPTETPTTTLQFPNGTLTEPVAGTVRYTPAVTTDLDEKAKVSANDTTAGYLNGKLVAGSGVTLTENSDGGNETLTVAATGTVSLAQLHEHAIGEDLTAETDGSKVTFILANEFEPETVAVYLAGARKRPVTDYTEDAGYQSITFGAAPSAAASLVLDYVVA